MKQRCLVILLALALICAFALPATAADAAGFQDVNAQHWAYSYVKDVVDQGYFNGTSATEFSPSGTMTRAMFVTVLGRLAGAQVDAAATGDFTDVTANTWYSGYVAWAKANNIVSGTSATTFAPDAPVTREQMAAIIYNYCQSKGFALPQAVAAMQFSDDAAISAYAKTGVAACQQAGLINGYADSSFKPAGLSTRAEVAAVVSRLAALLKGATAAESFTVTFDSNGGSAVASQTVLKDGQASQPANPTREGYVFKGWYGDAQLKAVYNFSAKVTANITLYAKWAAVTSSSTGSGSGSAVRPQPEEDLIGIAGTYPVAQPIEQAAAKTETPLGDYQGYEGYFSYELDYKAADGYTYTREIEVYIPEGARAREYWIAIALPDNCSSGYFLDKAGWFDMADDTHTCLLIMKPEGQWASVEEELPFVNAAMSTLASSYSVKLDGVNNTKLWSAFSYNYVVGYGAGGSALQMWAAANPMKMISQVYLDATETTAYENKLQVTGMTDIIETPQANNLNWEPYSNGTKTYSDVNGNAITDQRTFELLQNNDIPIPTWFVGTTTPGLVEYWQLANDCLDFPVQDKAFGQIYWQDKENSDAVATSVSDVKSQVAVQRDNDKYLSDELTANIYDFLTYYSGYDNNSPYGHFIEERLDYDAAIADGRMTYADEVFTTAAGKTDKETYIVYVPANSAQLYPQGAPVVYAFHGGGQTASVYLEATDAWRVADEYGFILVTFTRKGGEEWVRHLIEEVDANFNTDPDRRYCFGQSAGSGTVNGYVAKNMADLFTAIGYTSAATTDFADGNDTSILPAFGIFGQYDIDNFQVGPMQPGWAPGTTADKDKAWKNQQIWLNRLGLNYEDKQVEDNITPYVTPEETSVDILVNPTADYNRYIITTWANADGVPLFKWGQCFGRGHNSVASDHWLLWEDWFSKWDRQDDNTLLYYADGVGKGTAQTVRTAAPIESSTTIGANNVVGDYQKRQGYYTYDLSFDYNDKTYTRQAEVYLPEGARQREYWIAIALPDGAQSTTFLETSGWFEIADENHVCLLILKPSVTTDWTKGLTYTYSWNADVDLELAYVTKAMSTLVSSSTYYSAYSYDYVVGYGEGCAALQLWAASHPLSMISQAYLSAEVDASYLTKLSDFGATQVGETVQPNHMDFIGWTNSRSGAYVNATDINGDPVTQKRTFAAQTYGDVPIPTLLSSDGSDGVLSYWKAVNDCKAISVNDSNYGKVYWQDKANSDAIATSFTDIESQVAVLSNPKEIAPAVLTGKIYDFLTYYTGYDNNSVYGHFIAERVDYDAAIASGNMIYDDYDWEYVSNGNTTSTKTTYIIYVPDKAFELYGDSAIGAPVVFANHGAGQTASVFFDATGWWEVADDYGFIVVTFSRTSDAAYMAWLVDTTIDRCADELGIKVDASRLYTQGQSAGGGAVYNTLSQSDLTVGLFAAFGSTSGTRATAQANGSKLIVPMYATYGEYDYWPNKVGALVAGEWCGSQGAGQAAWTTGTQTYWLSRLLGIDADNVSAYNSAISMAEIDDNLSASYAEQNTPISLILNPTDDANRYVNYVWNMDYGNGEVPIFTWGQCYGRGHNCTIADMYEIWENCFSKWQRYDDDTLAYYADGVGNGEATLVDQTPPSLIALNLDDVAQPKNLPAGDDYDVNQLPLTGYFYKQLDGGRQVRYYVPETAVLRPYFHFIALPDGVDAGTFLLTSGWKQIADETGECLFLLLPGEGGWGELADEVAYINAAKAYHAGNGAYFTTFGIFYLEGYGAGAAPLEAWAAENPQFVISQAYVGGESAGNAVLTAAGNASFGWKQMTDGDIRANDKALNEDGTQKVLYQMANRLKDIVHPDNEGYEGLLCKNDLAVPTYLINGSADSLAYWQSVNEATGAADSTAALLGGTASVYGQKAENWATEYAGNISKVVSVSGAAASGYEFNRALRDELTDYSRYDNSISYGNALNYRMDYTAVQVARYTSADQEASGSVVAPTRGGNVNGSITIKAITIPGGNRDGSDCLMDMVLFVPASAGNSNIPVVFVSHGASQTANLFMDSTMWWQVAAENGFAVALTTRTRSVNAPASGYTNSQMFAVVTDYLQADGRFDMGRIYASGQSAGGGVTAGLAVADSDKLAGVFASNAGTPSVTTGGQPIPSGIAIGEGNYNTRAIPFYATKEEADAAGYVIRWNPVANADGSPAGFAKWVTYYADANDIDPVADLSDTVVYRGASSLNQGTQMFNGTLADWDTNTARHRSFYWFNDQDIPVMTYLFSLYEAHNNLCSHAELMWDFLKDYSLDTETGDRYYSTDGFQADPGTKIIYQEQDSNLLDGPLAKAVPWTEASDSNQLPLTGFFKASFDVNGKARQAYYYIPETAVLRPYYHFIAVDDLTDMELFLADSGWKQIADETGECLFIVVPNEVTSCWGAVADEAEYIAAARAWHAGTGASYSTTLGLFYVTGYGAGAAPLEAWAAANPIYVIAQAYIGGESAGAENLAAIGAESFGWSHMTDGDRNTDQGDPTQLALVQMATRLKDIANPGNTGYEGLLVKSDLAIPTWLINGSEDSLAYWLDVNNTSSSPVLNDGAQVYPQVEDNWATEYAGRISKVTVVADAETAGYAFTRQLRDELTDYSRYDYSISYGNSLTMRIDYTAIQVARYTSADKTASGPVQAVLHDGSVDNGTITIKGLDLGAEKNNYISDMVLYVPGSAVAKAAETGNKIPVVTVWHGASQTANLFMDSTMWWQVAAENGFAIALNTRTNPANAPRGNHSNNDVLDAVLAYLKADGRFDLDRVYATGQSAGGGATNGLLTTATDLLAAGVASNFPGTFNAAATATGKPIPVGLVVGEGNYSNRGIPGFTSKEEADAAGYVIRWDATKNANGADTGFIKWVNYFSGINSLDAVADLDSAVVYSGGNDLNGGADGNKTGTIADWNSSLARYRTFTWSDSQDNPIMTYIFTYYEAHNNIAGQAPMMWDFLEHYSVDQLTGIRYYSESGFTADDAEVLFAK